MRINTRAQLRAAGMFVIVSLLIVTTACGARPQATPTPTKTPRVEVTATPQPPTATPEPTATPLPTATPEAVRGTAAAELAIAEEAASEAGLAPASSRDPNVFPFTGLKPADPAILLRRPLAIKVDNDPAVVPQSGLDKADVVVESRKEACMTRLTAIYHSQDSARIGSIRSARLIDKELPVIFDAVLGFSGAVQPVLNILRQSDIGDHILTQRAFFRDPNIAVPFNLFGDTTSLWKTVAKNGWNTSPAPTATWTFSEAAPPGGSSVSRVDIPYPRPSFQVSWAYDAANNRWKRSINGKPHVDKVTGQQLSAANLVILTANHVQTLIPEQGTKLTQGPCSNASVEIQLWGEGAVKIVRDGKVYDGKWVRPDRYAPFRFIDANGRDIPLKPGNSWWQIVSPDMKVTAAG